MGGRVKRAITGLGLAVITFLAVSARAAETTGTDEPKLARTQIAEKYFGADAPWYVDRIPFVEIDDPEIEQVYYYRWKLYRSHVREIGWQGVTVTEFLDDVPWARHPYTDLNDSSPFHLDEGRWLRSPSIVYSLIDHLYSGDGNDRHFSEWIAAATLDVAKVTGDWSIASKHLDAMEYVFNAWDDHLDRERDLYWIDPISDATEYTIASIDASGAGFTDHPSKRDDENGFLKGYAYRPSINAYQFANARAIAEIALHAGQTDVAAEYGKRAADLRASVLRQLWNPELHHFTDRYARSTPYARAGDFVRGRELVGYVPWTYELVPATMDGADYSAAWGHVLTQNELAGPRGLRTVEPSYPRYMVQYRYDDESGKPECQWNGPSWPFQTSQVLTGLANLLNDYTQTTITRGDYLHLLRQYAHQHYLADGRLDLQEDYDPDRGGPIVGLARSHHYNHSTYVDLVISGLFGLRARGDDVLEVNPLFPDAAHAEGRPIRYAALEDVAYHGHRVSIVYDADGNHYRIGKGVTVYVDGRRAGASTELRRMELRLPMGSVPGAGTERAAQDFAVNVGAPGPPQATASSQAAPRQIEQAIDGRMWWMTEEPNGWSPAKEDASAQPWYTVEFGERQKIGAIELFFADDAPEYSAPRAFRVEYRQGSRWLAVEDEQRAPRVPRAGGVNRVAFKAVEADAIRIYFERPASGNFRLIELKAFAR